MESILGNEVIVDNPIDWLCLWLLYVLQKVDCIHRFVMTMWDGFFLLFGLIAGIDMNFECKHCDFNWWGNTRYYLQMVNRPRSSLLSNAAIRNCFFTWWLETNLPVVHTIWNDCIKRIRNYGVKSISHLTIQIHSWIW